MIVRLRTPLAKQVSSEIFPMIKKWKIYDDFYLFL
jgi:hypothetical protein